MQNTNTYTFFNQVKALFIYDHSNLLGGQTTKGGLVNTNSVNDLFTI